MDTLQRETAIEEMAQSMAFRSSRPMEGYRNDEIFLVAAGEQSVDHEYLVHSSDGKIAVAAEGEIYNSDELAKLLGVESSKKTKSGFGIVPDLYQKFKLEFPKFINGVFTIALWDSVEHSLHLIRDHVGSHSLYYTIKDGRLFFANTTKAIFASKLIEKKLAYDSPFFYFSSKALSPSATMFDNVFALRPSNIVTFKDEKISEHDYWRIHEINVDEKTSENEFIHQLQNLIRNSVEIRALSGGQYGAIISGGLDTSVVATTLLATGGIRKLPGFSIGFNTNEFSDSELQDLMVKKYNIELHRKVLVPEVFADTICEAVVYLDSPVNDNAFVGMYEVFKLAKESGCNYIFEGEGPDEIFPAGNTHGERQIRKFNLIPQILREKILGNLFPSIPVGTSLPNKIVRFLARLGMEEHERMVTWRTYYHGKNLKLLLNKDFHTSIDPYKTAKSYLEKSQNKDHLNKYQYGLCKSFLPDDLLFKNERMASCLGLINRTPLIDYRIVELALKIPSKFQITASTDRSDGIKLLYKKAIKGMIPDEIRLRKKNRGFSQPTSIWYRHELKEFVSDILLGERTKNRGIFNMDYVQKIVTEHMIEKSDMDYAINSMLIFELWMRKHIDEP